MADVVSRTGLTDLPSELLIKIFSMVPGPPSFLHALIGLCQKTRPAAEQSAYHSVRVTSHQMIRALCTTLRRRPDLGTLICSIALVPALRSWDSTRAKIDESMVFFAFTALIRGCPRIIRLVLEIEGADLQALAQLVAAIADAPAARTLATFVYHTRSSPSPAVQPALDGLLGRLSALTALTLASSIRYCASGPPDSCPPLRTLTLASPRLSSGAQSALGQLVRRCGGTLTELTLVGTAGLRYSALLEWLDAVGGRLERLSLSYTFCNGRHPVSGDPSDWAVVAAKCGRLRELRIRWCFQRIHVDSVALLPDTLRQIEVEEDKGSMVMGLGSTGRASAEAGPVIAKIWESVEQLEVFMLNGQKLARPQGRELTRTQTTQAQS